METAILLLLLALTDKNENMKDSLNRFLGFYKENRELIKMFANTLSQSNGEKDASRACGNENAQDEIHENYEESRPREEIGNLNILEEYLRRANA